MRVAILGTGAMGLGMARSMRRADLDVAAWNRTRAKAEPLSADGVAVADSVGDAVHGADVVITMLFDADSVLGIAPELLGALAPDAIWLQSATVGIDGIGRIAAAAGEAHLLDAPMLGTKAPAEQGNLVPLVSGSQALIDTAQPVLDAVGARTVVAGDRIGQGTALKLACNAWIVSITAATAQSIALTQALGLDGRLFLEAIEGGPSNSAYAQLKGASMLAGDFSPSFELDGGRKDIGLIADAKRSAGLPTDLIDGVAALFDVAAEAGHGADDMSSVYAAFGVSRA